MKSLGPPLRAGRTFDPFAVAVLLGLAYFALAELSLSRPISPEGIALFWLGSGLSLATFARAPRRYWGAFSVAVAIGSVLASHHHGRPLPTAVGYAVANAIEPLVGASLVGLIPGEPLRQPMRGLATILKAALPACAVGAAIAAATSWALGAVPRSGVVSMWKLWMVDDLLGIVLVAPLVLSWWPGSEWKGPREGRWFLAELALVLAAIFLLAGVVFLRPGAEDFRVLGREMVLPALLWAALRLGPRGASLATLILALFAVLASSNHLGPFGDPTLPATRRSIALQLFLVVLAVCALTPAVLLDERLRAERRVRAQERDLDAVLRSLAEGVITTDLRGAVLRMNPAAEAMLGCAEAEVRGRSFEELLTSRDQTASVMDAVQRAITEQIVVRDASDLGAVRKAGGGGVLLQTVSPLHNEDGTSLGAVIVLTDVTELREQQRKLAATAERLQRAKKLEAVGLLASGVAHDFANMLTVVRASGELLLGEVPTGSRELVDEILQATERARALTQRLLAFAGRQTLHPELVDLDTVMASFKKTLVRAVGDNISVHHESGGALPPVLVDRAQLEQAVLNLAINARDAMPQGGRLVVGTHVDTLDAERLAHSPEMRPGRYVCLEVSDTGSGMDEETLAKIFEPFFTTKPVGKGTGLGLSTVYGVVHQHAGFIDVKSEIGVGTTFCVWFPAASEDAPADEGSLPAGVDVASARPVSDTAPRPA